MLKLLIAAFSNGSFKVIEVDDKVAFFPLKVLKVKTGLNASELVVERLSKTRANVVLAETSSFV